MLPKYQYIYVIKKCRGCYAKQKTKILQFKMKIYIQNSFLRIY